MSRPTHWCHGVSVSGPVDPTGCCADTPAAPTPKSILANLNTERETRDRLKLAQLIARWTLLLGGALLLPALIVVEAAR